jgi:acyl carrier protein
VLLACSNVILNNKEVRISIFNGGITNMDKKEILKMILDNLEIEDDLGFDAELDKLEQWDSMAVIAFIAFADDKFNKSISVSNIKSCRTIGDLVDLLL